MMARRKLRFFLSHQRSGGLIRRSFVSSLHNLSSSSSSSSSNNLAITPGPMAKYQSYVGKQLIKDDPYQRQTMTILQKLYQELLTYTPSEHVVQQASSSIFNFRSFAWFNDEDTETQKRQKAPLGVYIYGGVGCGKTFMMDLFYEELPTSRKLRSHFNTFMIDLHKRLHKLKSANRKSSDESHIQLIADDIIQESYVICFDEFQVTDIADALLLKSLFTILWSRGCVVVATSNRPPEELYKNGLQRDLFLPFIDTVLKNMQVISMTPSPTDYRQLKHSDGHNQSSSLYFTPCTPATLSSFITQFQSLSSPNTPPIPLSLSVYGHNCSIPQAILSVHFPSNTSKHLHHIHSLSHTHVAYFEFKDLCGAGTISRSPLGASDYILLAASFSTIFISNVPRMTLQDRNELRRFITLIDALYEGRVLICLQAESEVNKLLNVSEEEKKFTPFDEVFAFDRTVSRLLEMQSQDYLKTQYSEWLHRRGSSKELLTSLLQSEQAENHINSELPALTPLLQDEPFVPQFQMNPLSSDTLREAITEELAACASSSSSSSSGASVESLSIAMIIRRAIEKRANIRLENSSFSSTSTVNLKSLSVDGAVRACYSSQGGLVFLSHDKSFRILTTSPPIDKRRKDL